jgi:putative flippase GtrA
MTEAASAQSGSPVREWARRLISREAGGMLARNTVVSCVAFAFDLALLWALVEFGHMDKVQAAALAFVAATSLHYAFCHSWIFRGTERALGSGYIYFLINAAIGLVITVALFAALIRWTPINYLVGRTLVSVVAGLTVFLLNAVLNFRRL